MQWKVEIFFFFHNLFICRSKSVQPTPNQIQIYTIAIIYGYIRLCRFKWSAK